MDPRHAALIARGSVAVSLLSDIAKEELNGEPEIVLDNLGIGVCELLDTEEGAVDFIDKIEEALRQWVNGREESIVLMTAKRLVSRLNGDRREEH
jgi:hypothetical protein